MFEHFERKINKIEEIGNHNKENVKCMFDRVIDLQNRQGNYWTHHKNFHDEIRHNHTVFGWCFFVIIFLLLALVGTTFGNYMELRKLQDGAIQQTDSQKLEQK